MTEMSAKLFSNCRSDVRANANEMLTEAALFIYWTVFLEAKLHQSSGSLYNVCSRYLQLCVCLQPLFRNISAHRIKIFNFRDLWCHHSQIFIISCLLACVPSWYGWCKSMSNFLSCIYSFESEIMFNEWSLHCYAKKLLFSNIASSLEV